MDFLTEYWQDETGQCIQFDHEGATHRFHFGDLPELNAALKAKGLPQEICKAALDDVLRLRREGWAA